MCLGVVWCGVRGVFSSGRCSESGLSEYQPGGAPATAQQGLYLVFGYPTENMADFSGFQSHFYVSSDLGVRGPSGLHRPSRERYPSDHSQGTSRV